MWTTAKIVSITGFDIMDISKKKVVVEFYQDVCVRETRYNADSSFIAPYGTMSTVQNWRSDLKEGDEVDTLNGDKEWEVAKIEWIDNRKNEKKMFMVRVRFSSGKDEYIGLHTTRIQKVHT